MSLTVGSLFSGIGGLDLGLERAGMTVIWQSEIDPYCCRVLKKWWPNVPNLGDVTQVDWSTVERPDVICGGYPCQPFSLAGARAGEDDARHLWPYMVGAIRALRPRFAVMENVPGHLSLGFGRVLGDLAESGYDTEWDCIPAAAVGAPHIRDRVYIVAYTDSSELWDNRRCGPSESKGRDVSNVSANHGTQRHVAHAEEFAVGAGLCANEQAEQRRGRFGNGGSTRNAWAAEPSICRVAHGVPSRVDRLTGLGNAVVPQVAEFVGRRIVASS